MNVRTKFKSIAIPDPEIIGVPKNWGGHGYATQGEAVGGRDGTVRNSVGEFLYALHTYYSSLSTRLPKILDCSFEWGLHIFTRFRDRPIAAFVLQNAFFLTPL